MGRAAGAVYKERRASARIGRMARTDNQSCGSCDYLLRVFLIFAAIKPLILQKELSSTKQICYSFREALK